MDTAKVIYGNEDLVREVKFLRAIIRNNGSKGSKRISVDKLEQLFIIVDAMEG